MPETPAQPDGPSDSSFRIAGQPPSPRSEEELMAFIAELAASFCQDCDSLLNAIRNQIRHRDADALSKTSHTLKGMLGNIAAEAGFEAVKRLEATARNKDFDSAETAMAALEVEIDRLEPVLSGLVN